MTSRVPAMEAAGRIFRLCLIKINVLKILLMICVFYMAVPPLHAEDAAGTERSPFRKGQFSIQLVGGVFAAPFIFNSQRPKVDYFQTNLRMGWMLSDPHDPKYFFKGNWEGLVEITYSNVSSEEAGLFGGATILLRYNILSLERQRLYPFIHLGGGVIYNDVYEDESQSLIGQAIEFSLRCGVGVRLRITDQWSFDLEGAFEHISNAGLANRNTGLNAGGGFVGITRSFY